MYLIPNKMHFVRKNIDHEQWFVLYTKPNFEKMIDRRLKELGFHSYLPLQKELRYWNDRKVWIETPLFRSYIFIKTNLRKKDQALKIGGILKYVRIGSQMAILSQTEIDRIKKLCTYTGKITIEFENLERGKRVEFCNGILKGLEGFLVDINDSQKVRIHIKSLNCFASVTVDSDSVSFKGT